MRTLCEWIAMNYPWQTRWLQSVRTWPETRHNHQVASVTWSFCVSPFGSTDVSFITHCTLEHCLLLCYNTSFISQALFLCGECSSFVETFRFVNQTRASHSSQGSVRASLRWTTRTTKSWPSSGRKQLKSWTWARFCVTASTATCSVLHTKLSPSCVCSEHSAQTPLVSRKNFLRDKWIVKAKRPVHTGYEPGVVWRNPLFVSVQWVLTGERCAFPMNSSRNTFCFATYLKSGFLKQRTITWGKRGRE